MKCPFSTEQKAASTLQVRKTSKCLTCKREHTVCAQRRCNQPTVFDSDAVTKVERFIYAAPVILYAPAALQAVSINN